MVEIGTIAGDKKLENMIETKLKKLIDSFSFMERGRLVYKGHPAIYTDIVAETLELVQKSGGLNQEELLKRKPHWHNDFKVIIVKDLEQHNYTFATEIVRNLARHTSQDSPVIWITPVGPMGHYPVIAELINKLGKSMNLKPELIFPFAMDEWSDEHGNILAAPKFTSYMTRFQEDMYKQFYSKLTRDMKIPEMNLHFAEGENIRHYLPFIKNLLGKKAGVIFTGGVGMTGHIMFWEPTYGTLLGKVASEKVTYIRGAPLTTETKIQNRFTSTASAPVPSYANTIGLGLFCMFREHERMYPGKVNALFGLDNVEEPLIWQRFISQGMLAMTQEDPSFGATYPATVPGAYILVENHLKKFNVPAK